jgi:hypothetical protein
MLQMGRWGQILPIEMLLKAGMARRQIYDWRGMAGSGYPPQHVQDVHAQ